MAADGAPLAGAEGDIQRARESVALSLTALQREIARTFDWRHWVCRKPHLSIALAFGLGLALGRHRG
jgi:hypothetical protein